MKQKTFILSIIVAAMSIGCHNEQDKKGQINPLDQLESVDNLLAEIAEKPQKLIALSDKKTIATGAKGTVIHVDPNRLETVDGTPLGDNIQIELLEMTDNASLLFNNAQTVSNGQILVTGGAYYLNMISNGKQLKMKQGQGLEVEFPKLTKNEMGLFLGERDRMGQLNWIQAEQSFENKNLEKPEKPKPKKTTKKESYNQIDLILDYVDEVEAEPLTQEEIEAYERRIREYETASKTYKSVELMNFGWINCDRFWNDPSPKTNIQLLVNNDSLSGARMYAVFSDIESIMSLQYWKGMEGTNLFNNVPLGKELTIIAVSAKNETPFFFETTINTETDSLVEIDFVATTQAELREKIKRLN